MITSNVIERVFRLRYKNNTGTCFFIDVNGGTYFVTARHVLQEKDGNDELLDELKSGEIIQVERENNWVDTTVLDVRHSEVSDVSVFTAHVVVGAHPLAATLDGITYGQDLYFLGFPYGMSSDVGELNNNFPLPYVRKGIVMALHLDRQGKPFVIDGHNNSGFSGGPVVFKRPGIHSFQVGGVIHGYYPEYDDTGEEIENTNSGIVIAYSIENAIDLINEM